MHVHYTSKGYPKAYGQAEITNTEIKKGIKKRQKPEELNLVMWAYTTITRTATRKTPHSMAFGAEAMVLVEVNRLNYRIVSLDRQNNEDDLRKKLDLIEEKREVAAAKVVVYQQRMAMYLDFLVKPKDFRTGDLVLKEG